MRKFLKYIVFVIAFILFMPNTKASCSYTRLANLKKLASNVNITYTYEIVDNKAVFTFTVANIVDGIYFFDSLNEKSYTQHGEFKLNNFEDGKKYRFFIKSSDKNCKDEVLLTKYITLPKYNQFYGDPICEGIENYTLCQKWGTFNVTTYKDYVAQIQKYKSKNKKENTEVIEEKQPTLTDKILNFLYKYYIFILVGIIVIGSSLIFYLSRKNRFDI